MCERLNDNFCQSQRGAFPNFLSAVVCSLSYLCLAPRKKLASNPA